MDTARGLSCLHELANPQIIHRCVSPINILLDENLNAKIISFGLSTLNREKDVDTKIIVGRFVSILNLFTQFELHLNYII